MNTIELFHKYFYSYFPISDHCEAHHDN